MFHDAIQIMFHDPRKRPEWGNEIGTKTNGNETGTNCPLQEGNFVPSEFRSGPISFRSFGGAE